MEEVEVWFVFIDDGFFKVGDEFAHASCAVLVVWCGVRQRESVFGVEIAFCGLDRGSRPSLGG